MRKEDEHHLEAAEECWLSLAAAVVGTCVLC
jgi:hypothetical protein